MTKKFAIIAGIVALAALAAAAVAFFLLKRTDVMESLDIDDEDDLF